MESGDGKIDINYTQLKGKNIGQVNLKNTDQIKKQEEDIEVENLNEDEIEGNFQEKNVQNLLELKFELSKIENQSYLVKEMCVLSKSKFH